MNNNINNILEKYWNAETSLKEESLLRAYFASSDVEDNHKQFVDFFSHITDYSLVESEINVDSMLNNLNDIDELIAKYEEGNTSLVEEKLLQAYFSDEDVKEEHLYLKPLFDFYEVAKQMSTDMEFSNDGLVDEDIDSLLQKYINAETSLDEERVLSNYFSGEHVKDIHLPYKPMFAFFDQASEMTTDINIASSILAGEDNIDALLERYWAAETDVDEEKVLHDYMSSGDVSVKHYEAKDLFYYYASQRNKVTNINLEELLNKQEKGSHSSDSVSRPSGAGSTRVFSMRKMAASIAAIFVLGFAAISIMNQSSEPETQYRGKFVQLDEEAEAQEAYEITKQAFALLSKKMNKGSKTINKSVKKAEKASIFK